MANQGKKVRIFSALEVANICGVVNQTAINWIKNGHLKAFTTPGGQYRVYAEDLHEFLSSRGMRVPDEIEEIAGSGERSILIVEDEENNRFEMPPRFFITTNSVRLPYEFPEALTASIGPLVGFAVKEIVGYKSQPEASDDDIELSSSPLKRVSQHSLIEKLRTSLRNNNTLEAIDLLGEIRIKGIDSRKILRPLAEILVDEKIDNKINEEAIMQIESLAKKIRDRQAWTLIKAMFKTMLKLTMLRELVPLEEEYPCFFDFEKQGEFKHLEKFRKMKENLR